MSDSPTPTSTPYGAASGSGSGSGAGSASGYGSGSGSGSGQSSSWIGPVHIPFVDCSSTCPNRVSGTQDVCGAKCGNSDGHDGVHECWLQHFWDQDGRPLSTPL